MLFRRTMLVLPLVCFVVYGGACHDDHEHGSSTPGLDDVVYEGGASDEALAALLAATPKQGEKVAKITAPAAGTKLSDPPTFEWTFGPVSSLPLHRERITPRGRSPFAMPVAHAHGTPMNGTGYLLVLSTPSDPKLLRVFTSQTSYKPDATAWARLKKSPGNVDAVVTTALFDTNKVIASGGPFGGESVAFEILP